MLAILVKISPQWLTVSFDNENRIHGTSCHFVRENINWFLAYITYASHWLPSKRAVWLKPRRRQFSQPINKEQRQQASAIGRMRRFI
jgi:hypothetical protein